MTEPTTAAGRALGSTVEQMTGLQFKSRDMYRGWLADMDALALAIEAEARAASRLEQELAALRKAAQPLVDRWLATFGPDGYPNQMPDDLRVLRAALAATPAEGPYEHGIDDAEVNYDD